MDVRNSAIAGLKVIDPEEFIATFVLKLKGAAVVLSANRHGITEAFSEKRGGPTTPPLKDLLEAIRRSSSAVKLLLILFGAQGPRSLR